MSNAIPTFKRLRGHLGIRGLLTFSALKMVLLIISEYKHNRAVEFCM